MFLLTIKCHRFAGTSRNTIDTHRGIAWPLHPAISQFVFVCRSYHPDDFQNRSVMAIICLLFVPSQSKDIRKKRNRWVVSMRNARTLIIQPTPVILERLEGTLSVCLGRKEELISTFRTTTYICRCAVHPLSEALSKLGVLESTPQLREEFATNILSGLSTGLLWCSSLCFGYK